VSELEGLNRHPHSEHPKPRKCGSSTHSSFRLMVRAAAPPRCLTTSLSAACCLGRSVLLSQCCAPDCGRELSAVRWRKMYRGTKFTRANLDGLSGILHTRKILVYAPVDLTASFEAADSLNSWFQDWCILKRSELLSIRACIQRSFDRSTRGVLHALRESYPVGAAWQASFPACARVLAPDPNVFQRMVCGKQRAPSRAVWGADEC
jgi:hypothetical protein